MWLADLINILQDHMAMLVKETGNTLYMTFVSTLFAYILAMPLGVVLVVTREDGLYPLKSLYRLLDIIRCV